MSRRAAARTAAKPPAPASRRLPALLATLSALVLLGWFSREVSDPDTWWHLKTGQYILENRNLPVPDPFSYTTGTGTPAPGELTMRYFNLTHEWLAQVIFYLVQSTAGFPGLVLLRASMLAGFCAIAGLLAWRRSGSFYLALGAALAAAAVARYYLADRPFQFTFFLLAVTVAVLEFRRPLWLLPPLFLLWANLHGGYFLGWVALGAYCAEALLLRTGARRLWIASALAVVASGVNPNGYGVPRILLLYRNSALQSSLLEWHPTALWPPDAFGILLVTAAAVLIWQRRRTRPADWLLFLPFAAASLIAVRNTILIGFLAPILIAAYVPWKPRLPRLAAAAATASLVVVLAAGIARGTMFQLRAAEWRYPAGAADFLLAHNITGRMFNTYGFGGYLIWRLWPHQRVFIDGRALNETVFNDHRRIAYNADATGGPTREQLLHKYGADVIVMSAFQHNTGSVYLLVPALADPKQTEWKFVYADDAALVFMRRPPPGVAPIEPLRVLDTLEAQCRNHVRHLPSQPLCARGLADVFQRIGDLPRARRWMRIFSQFTASQ
jgi:hypothetical protein